MQKSHEEQTKEPFVPRGTNLPGCHSAQPVVVNSGNLTQREQILCLLSSAVSPFQVAKNCVKLGGGTDCQIIIPRRHINAAARTDFTGKYGPPCSEQAEQSFGSVLVANCTFGKEYWRSPISKLRYSSSDSGS
jgi:hypothetical protein